MFQSTVANKVCFAVKYQGAEHITISNVPTKLKNNFRNKQPITQSQSQPIEHSSMCDIKLLINDLIGKSSLK